VGLVVSLERANYLHKLHNRHWVHEVHSNDLVGAVWNHTRDLGNRNAGGVTCQNAVIGCHFSNFREDFLLEIEVFVNCFND